MSDASMPHCEKCNEPAYACTCVDDTCVGCGGKLRGTLERQCKLCFECYLFAEE